MKHDNEVKKHAECIIAMSTDFMNGGITTQTYITNLEMISKKLIKESVKREHANKSL